MSLKAYKNIAVPKEIKADSKALASGAACVTADKNSSLKSNKFFYIAGLMIFLYGGLKVLDYSDRYTGKPALPKQALDRILTPFVPQALTAQESANSNAEKNAEPKDEKGGAEKTVPSGEKQIGDKLTESRAEKNEVVKDGAEAFFDPLGITSASEVRLLEALGERRLKLEARDVAISKRELELELFEKKLQEKWDTLQVIQEEVKNQLGQLDKGEVAKEQSLSKVYENMKPKDAARVFDLLNIPVVMKIIVHMKEKKISEILGFVSTERARDITQELAFKSKSLARPASRA